ncbi:MAG: AAA family ATPase [Bacillota bacterium]|nr:AAA family ATPase [Bacillota bacterium]
MAERMAIVNQKGGVGKTTTAVNLAAYLAIRGKRVILLDLDAQANATSGLGFERDDSRNGSYELLINEVPLCDCVHDSGRRNLQICPGSIHLAGAEVELATMESRERRLRNALDAGDLSYDYLLIDCPPSLGLLTLNALTAADSLIVPIQTEYYALEGVTLLLDTIQSVKQSLNPELQIFGIVLTMSDLRTQLAAQVEEEVRKAFGERVFKTVIPRNVRLSEAPSHGQAIVEYDRRSRGAEAYQQLAREVIRRSRRRGSWHKGDS